ncbi:glycosyltransferase family 4 protein [Flavobacterium sp. IMCC34518]|uniref:glycosyltransferase family 4 protein n=1 Tax=Flavobacterium sp. IMCC34518 TaxID=3003623 RepID=UPI0024826641|nr:glycosyltransferase family 4 protein [Flavobacterium sp. IMCC34518]
MSNKILVFNHIFWPDKINTARHISELTEELVARGWDVSAVVGNRFYGNHKKIITPKNGVWNGVKYSRTYIPPFNQKKNLQRLLTSFWLVLSWIVKLPFIGKYDAIIIGTNPPFVYLLVPFIKLFKRNTKILMWGFDLYPEAIIVSKEKSFSFLGKVLKSLAKFCYGKIDVIVDIGPCMREIYRQYNHSAKEETLPPWSFVEPIEMLLPHFETRQKLFKNANLTLLYTGTIGNAHEFDNFLQLARELNKRNASVGFCFAGFGNRFDDLKLQIVDNDTNISFGGFVETDQELEERLSSADIMLISLKEEWTGISVPSKYFSAIAIGKAVLFSGAQNSALSVWTREYDLGFQVQKETIDKVANVLCEIANNPELISKMKENSFKIYQENFSKKVICDKWSLLLERTINYPMK